MADVGVNMMKQIMLGIMLGATITALAFIPVIMQQRRGQYENGKHQGEIFGRIEVWTSLNKHFAAGQAPSRQILDYIPIKDVGICVVEKDGVLTIETR